MGGSSPRSSRTNRWAWRFPPRCEPIQPHANAVAHSLPAYLVRELGDGDSGPLLDEPERLTLAGAERAAW